MIAASAQFARAIFQATARYISLTPTSSGQPITGKPFYDDNGKPLQWWESGGSTIDNSQTSRRQLTLGVADNTVAAELLPLSTEITAHYGVKYADGTVETVPAGVFVVANLAPAMTNEDPQLTLTCLDRWAYVANNRWTTAQNFPAGSSIVKLITDSVISALPAWLANTQVKVQTTDKSKLGIARVIPTPGDRSGTVTDLATSIGAEVYFDATGALVIRDVPTAGKVDVTIGNGVLLDGTQQIDTDRTFNQVVVTRYYSDGTPTRESWTFSDRDPKSPTSVQKIGAIPFFYESIFITNSAQAAKAAQSLLAASRGFETSFAVDAVPDPRLEPGDTALVIAPRRNLDGTLRQYGGVSVIDALTLPLDVGDSQAITLRYWQSTQGLPDESSIAGITALS